MNENPWTSDELIKLHKFWKEDISTAEIGRRLGRSKNAVVGKAFRLGLPERPSPIKKCHGIKLTLKRPKLPRETSGVGRRCLFCGNWFYSREPKSINRRCPPCEDSMNSDGATFLTVYTAQINELNQLKKLA